MQVDAQGTTVWIATQDNAELSTVEATRPDAPVRPRASLSPAERPGALVCARRRCVVTDAPTRRVVAARF